jgi:hypothetical protein
MAVCQPFLLVYRRNVTRQEAIDMLGVGLGGAGRRDFFGPAVPIAVFGRHVCGVVRDQWRRVFGVNRGCRAKIRSADGDTVWVATMGLFDGGRSLAGIGGGKVSSYSGDDALLQVAAW